MTLIKTYFDTGIYIKALRPNPIESQRAQALIDDAQRFRVTSDVLLLELLPISLRRHNLREIHAFNVMINRAPEFVRLDSTHVDLAKYLSKSYAVF